jgi:transposase
MRPRVALAIQKYFVGAPFYRQQTLQQLLGMPVGASTVFDQCEQLANAIRPLFACLLALAGKAARYWIDDTTNRILTQGPVSKPDRRTGKPKERSGVYTSVAIAVRAEGQACVLYQTNVGHAGEWLDEILRTRPPTAPPPLIMSDASSHNRPSVLKDYHQALCNAHARREFVDVAVHFPEQVAGVLERYALIWEHDRHCQAEKRSPAQRPPPMGGGGVSPHPFAAGDGGDARLGPGAARERSRPTAGWGMRSVITRVTTQA